jgi:GlcNAc-P-P-Und epimerase
MMKLLVTGGSGFIGTNLIAEMARAGVPILNLDWNPPLDPAQAPFWQNVNLMEEETLQRAFQQFAPTHVVHLAARTDTDENEDIDAYLQNHEGTLRLLRVVNATTSIQRLVVTSTQFVCEAGYQPKHDLDFKPFTLYGETKRRTELATREAGLTCTWTIIRPTTIWGPWSLRYRDVMFKVMRKGLYLHPSRKKVVRSYGYVGNVVWQIRRILELTPTVVSGKVFYVGDQPFDLRIWVEAVSKALTGRKVRYVPLFVVHALAMTGDVLKLLRIPFPMTTGRFKSMTSDYVTPMDSTIAALGHAPYSMDEGIKATVEWYDKVSAGVVAHTLKDTREWSRKN